MVWLGIHALITNLVVHLVVDWHPNYAVEGRAIYPISTVFGQRKYT